MTRRDLIASAAAHLFVLALLLIARPPAASLAMPGPDAVQVDLIDARQLSSPAPRPASPAPQPEPIEDGVRIDRPKPAERTAPRQPEPERVRPAEAEAPRETPREAPSNEAARTALPWAPAGAAGLKGQVAVDDRNFEFAYYLQLVRQRVAGVWVPPAGLGGRGPVQAVVQFRIARSGDVTGIRLEQSSGIEWFDQSAVRAVTISRPLPPLPAGYAGNELGVHFGFSFETP